MLLTVAWMKVNPNCMRVLAFDHLVQVLTLIACMLLQIGLESGQETFGKAVWVKDNPNFMLIVTFNLERGWEIFSIFVWVKANLGRIHIVWF